MQHQKNELIKDLTTGSVPKTLILFAAPLFLSGVLQTIYNMVDMIVVGNVVGSDGLAGVSIGGDLLTLLTFIAFGFSNAGQIIISQYIGAGKKENIGKVIGTLFVILGSSAIILTLICLGIYPYLLSWINTPPEAYAMAESYIVTCICGLVFIYGYNVVSAIMRGMGDSKRPFIFIAIASIINLILDILFVAILNLGTFGAALATVIGQAASFIFAITVLYKSRDNINFSFKLHDFKIHKEVARPLIALGIPMIIQSAAINFSKLFVNSWINTYGVTATAISGIGNKLEMIIGVLGQGLSSAGGAMIAQNIGAGKFERIPKVIVTSLIIMISAAVLMGIPTFFFPEWTFGLFTQDLQVMKMAVSYVPVAMVLYTGCALRPSMFALINGSGNSKLNLTVALLDGVLTRIGLALFLGVLLDYGIYGFWYGNAISGLVPFVIGSFYYCFGHWKKNSGVI